jgi:hypothetical protein
MWRRRVGVEPTIRSAKGRIGGFEGRDSHRTIFASDVVMYLSYVKWEPGRRLTAEIVLAL